MKITKLSLLSILLIYLSRSANAQLQFGGKIGIGGATQSKLGNICDNTDLRLVYNAGLTAKNQFNEWFALKGDVMYSQKGSSYDIEESGSTTEVTNKLGYLLVPVKAEFSAPVKKSKIFFATGPYAGFLLHADQDINDVLTDMKDNTKSTDLGLTMELGFIKPLSRFDLVFSLNYYMGITEIYEFDEDIQNKVLTCNIGILF